MSENNELCAIELDLIGGKVLIQAPVEHKDALEKIANDPNFSGKVEQSKVMVLPSKDNELNDNQTAWAEFGVTPSTLSLFFDMKTNDVWEKLNKNFEFNSTNVIKKSEIFFNSKNEVIENSRYFISLAQGLYVTFVEIGGEDSEDATISSLVFNYDGSTYDHDALAENLIKAFSDAIIMYDEVKESKIYIANYTEDGFDFDPYDLGKITLNLRGKKKQVYDEIVESINTNRKGTYVLHGERGSGKTQYLKKLLKKVKKKIIYVPIDSFEYVFHNNKSFFNQIKNFGDCVVVFEDCELYFRSNAPTNIYLSMLLRFNDSLVSNKTNFNCILILNTESLNEVCSDLRLNKKVNFVSMKDDVAQFNGYK
jgi:hypothetical protein